MNWSDVGDWIKDNAGNGAALVGSLLTGNVPGAVAAGVSMVGSATGTDDPAKALESLQRDPQTVVKLRELANKEEESIREHLREMKQLELEDQQAAHHEQQETIRGGDNASDEYVRHTRPRIARQSWFATIAYCIGFEGAQALGGATGADPTIAGILIAPAGAYMGFRTADKLGLVSKAKVLIKKQQSKR